MTRWLLQLTAWFSTASVVVWIENGQATVRRGRIRPALLAELADLANASQIVTACILATTTDHGFRLTFHGIPEPLHQRFRNVWSCHWR
jgi:hypothetical protein